ncbi:sigma-70 family RNA polymerase sigma factor [Dinghuibacter silviterrae]|uniref:RNA polymerase sigma-70 factor (ECF subfamily) n=1 Tax=Dinghuibacter silviterrae TaxID=1539049 RepID=A0A4V3GKS5_9BACT|nr:sigma-70 family RNA polymerase sigma factor [Dinghuibacter silviterrae]TDW96822.1 RNA polymerase sigma-70 factor (ECF subfamily) [Dinghuibacter silviterrae]
MSTDCNIARQEQQFTQLFREYAPRIFYYFKKHVRREDVAEDLVQEVFASIWRRKDSLLVDDILPAGIGAYLFVATRNHLYNYLEKSVRDKKAPGADTAYTHVEEYLSERQKKEHYRIILDTLSPQRRQAFQLSRDYNLSYQEIADQMGIAPRTVEKHISAALQTLRTRMVEWILLVVLFINW